LYRHGRTSCKIYKGRAPWRRGKGSWRGDDADEAKYSPPTNAGEDAGPVEKGKGGGGGGRGGRETMRSAVNNEGRTGSEGKAIHQVTGKKKQAGERAAALERGAM